MSTPVILVDDEQHLRTACTQALELAGFKVESFDSARTALDRITPDWPGILISDIKMAGMDGLELMQRALDVDTSLPVILITGHGDVPMAVRAMRDGAYDFIEKPFASEVLVDAARRASEKRALVLENRRLREALAAGSTIESRLVGASPVMAQLRREVISYAATDADVLLIGETGAGKELVARALHDNSPRKSERFVPINCGALPETVIESELFGHEPGAFTGAAKKRIGRFEYAKGGTLFLDEIESMPLDLQIKLLRVLQDRCIVRLGSNDEISVDVRIVAATKADLRKQADAGSFREDLFYRLNVLAIAIPALRERKADVPLLFTHFVSEAAGRYKREPIEVSQIVLSELCAHGWPGNVRELQNVATRYALGLGLDIAGSKPHQPVPKDGSAPLSQQVAEIERRIIAKTLDDNGGNLKATYEALGISRKTLYDKIKRYGLSNSEPEVGQ